MPHQTHLSAEAPPPPRALAARIFARYLRGLARKHFSAVHLGGPVVRAGGTAGEPAVLFVANHTNWWDGFLAALVTDRLGLHFQILMEAVNLGRYPVFDHVGALPLRRDSRSGAYADLQAAAQRLGRAGTALWIFPQGRRRPAAAPIGDTERGAAQLALLAGRPLDIQPVAFRYAYLGEQLPEAFAWLGERFPATRRLGDSAGSVSDGGATARAARRELAGEIERRLQLTVTALDRRLAEERLEEFTLLVPGRLSINKRLDRARHALGLLPGPFDPRNG